MRGQRKTNARTRKGPERTVAGKKKAGGVNASQGSRDEGPSKVKKNVAVGQARIKSTFNNTDHLDHRPTGAVISWASAGQVGFQGLPASPRCMPQQMAAEACAAARWSTACARSTSSSGSGSGRETAIRSSPRQAWRSAPSRTSPPARTTVSARPSAAASGARFPKRRVVSHGSVHRPHHQKSAATSSTSSAATRIRASSLPPGQHGRRRIQEKEYLTQLQEKQRARFTYGVMEKQFRRYYEEAATAPARPVATC